MGPRNIATWYAPCFFFSSPPTQSYTRDQPAYTQQLGVQPGTPLHLLQPLGIALILLATEGMGLPCPFGILLFVSCVWLHGCTAAAGFFREAAGLFIIGFCPCPFAAGRLSAWTVTSGSLDPFLRSISASANRSFDCSTVRGLTTTLLVVACVSGAAPGFWSPSSLFAPRLGSATASTALFNSVWLSWAEEGATGLASRSIGSGAGKASKGACTELIFSTLEVSGLDGADGKGKPEESGCWIVACGCRSWMWGCHGPNGTAGAWRDKYAVRSISVRYMCPTHCNRWKHISTILWKPNMSIVGQSPQSLQGSNLRFKPIWIYSTL